MSRAVTEMRMIKAQDGQAKEAGKLEIKHEFIELRARGWRLR